LGTRALNTLITMLTKVLIVIAATAASIQTASGATDKILCYYASWGATRPGDGKFTPEDIDANLCTHVNYAFLGLNDDGSLLILDNATDIVNGKCCDP
jgi:chitinase